MNYHGRRIINFDKVPKLPTSTSIVNLPWLRVIYGNKSFAFAIENNVIVATPKNKKHYLGMQANGVWIEFKRKGALVIREEPSPFYGNL